MKSLDHEENKKYDLADQAVKNIMSDQDPSSFPRLSSDIVIHNDLNWKQQGPDYLLALHNMNRPNKKLTMDEFILQFPEKVDRRVWSIDEMRDEKRKTVKKKGYK
jgi:hypothetical protein